MALPVAGKTYRFKNAGASNRYLNLYYTGSVADGLNVVLWTGDNSTEQNWYFNGTHLLVARNNAFSLDKYTVAGNANNNNADIWTANDPTNQKIYFEGKGGNTVRIKLSSSSLCLTAASNANGTAAGKSPTSAGNVYWATSNTSTLQQWIFEEVADDPVVPGKEVIVTDMPKKAYPNNTEYFHPASKMVNGTWVSNNGAAIENKMKAFYKKVYGVDPAGNMNYLYNLYLARLTDMDVYHIGIDINKGRGTNIISGHSGTVIKCGETKSNEVAIYDGIRTYYYLHMEENKLEVKKGDTIVAGETLLGYESDAGWASGPHLHVEIFPGRDTSGPKATPLINETTTALCPYDYL